MTTLSRATAWGKPALVVLLSAGLLAPVAGSAQAARYEAPVDVSARYEAPADVSARYEAPADVMARYEATGELDIESLVTQDGETVESQEIPIAMIIQLIVLAIELAGEWEGIEAGCSAGQSECESVLAGSKAVQGLLRMVTGFLPGLSPEQLTTWLAELVYRMISEQLAYAGQ